MTLLIAPNGRLSIVTLASWSIGLATSVMAVDAGDDPDPMRFSEAIRAFEQADRESFPPRGCVLFLGSSSIRRWDVEASFPDMMALNRGFGGSQISDVIHFADQVLAPYQPRAIVMYAGDNDIASGKSADRVYEDVVQFASIARTMAPGAPLLYLSIKPSPARQEHWPEMNRANMLIERASQLSDQLHFVDVASPMLGPDRQFRLELYAEDQLHLDPSGYEIWTEILTPVLRSIDDRDDQ